jgi:hypothetical protein
VRKQREPARRPHPDGRVEAELLRVLAQQRAAGRVEARLEDIRAHLGKLDRSRHRAIRGGSAAVASAYAGQSADLQGERTALEKELAALHDDMVERLARLGNDAVYLLPEALLDRSQDTR